MVPIAAPIAPQVCTYSCGPGAYAWLGQLVPIVTICAPLLAVLTFWLGYRQREKERRFSFFNDVVVAPCMTEILKFFSKCGEDLIECAREHDASSIRRAQPRKVTTALTKFSQDLYALEDFVVERMEGFDDRTTDETCKVFERIEQEITCWFGACSTAPPSIDDLELRIRAAKRSVVRVLYKGKIVFLR